ncbi:choline transport protein [Aspergillus sclerotiicarbonarius CBS 121057]|uniref:Choline transport protein n=1 Tax=Aspergillus sclerotiicarbonarius (strain CBS 121057 / IBT 28362) TaxID=1448318 RepID=A0A319ELS3_ASPSB|nr:choline transport protein [Aspergillus sclerotiicarbonarius CBS 121057]
MAEAKCEKATSSGTTPDIGDMVEVKGNDALRLAEMGYSQEMKRQFSRISLLGVCFSIANSWFGISASMITGISSGGTALSIYGIPLIALVSTCVGITLSELASAMPNSGGQYFWAHQLAPRKYARVASFATGYLSWAGSIFTSASIALSLATIILGMWQMGHPSFVIKSWHTVIAYDLVNLLAYIFNTYERILPGMAKVSLYTSLISFLIIIITVPATSHNFSTARAVFAHFANSTGWSSDAIAFFVGLINPNWTFACLDSATHLAEEIPHPETNIPFAILGTVVLGFVTSWPYVIAIFFSVTDLEAIINTATGSPTLELYYQALGNKAGAIVLEALVLATGLGCLIASHTWQSRLCWSFARDKGIMFHQWLSTIPQQNQVPMNAHTLSCGIVAVVGLLYLGSATAFNSMVSACIVLLYGSYAIPVSSMLYKGRRNIEHGPFWLGWFGLVCNVVVLLWTAFTLVIYAFPASYPVTSSSFNYVIVVYVVVAVIAISDWFARGRKEYRA